MWRGVSIDLAYWVIPFNKKVYKFLSFRKIKTTHLVMTKVHMAKGEKKKICGSLYRFSKTNFEAKCRRLTRS